MDRKTRRDNKRILDTVKRKAKLDMASWVDTLSGRKPTQEEVLAFQAGYILGINRGANNEK